MSRSEVLNTGSCKSNWQISSYDGLTIFLAYTNRNSNFNSDLGLIISNNIVLWMFWYGWIDFSCFWVFWSDSRWLFENQESFHWRRTIQYHFRNRKSTWSFALLKNIYGRIWITLTLCEGWLN